MRKKLLSGLFWVLLANLLIKPFWILCIEVGVQNAVGDTTYGFYFVVFNLAYIFNILLDLGVTNFNTRNIARNPLLIQKHLSGILTIKVLLLALYVIVTFTTALLLGYNSRQFGLLAWLCLNQFLNSLITYLRSNFQGLLMFKMDSLLSVLDRILMIVICALLLWGPFLPAAADAQAATGRVFRIEWFVYAQTAAYLIAATVALIAINKKVGMRHLTWNKPFTLAILRKSAPFALLVLLMASYNRIDPILLEKLLPLSGDFHAGVYAKAFRLLDALTMLAYLVSILLLPIYSKLTKEVNIEKESIETDTPISEAMETNAYGAGKPCNNATKTTVPNNNDSSTKELADITRMIFSLMFVVTVSIALTLYWFGDGVLELLYHDSTNVGNVGSVFRILILGFVPIGMTYIFGTLLTANGSLKQLNLFATLALGVNIIVNLICIPRWAANGAAVASLTTQTFMGIAQMILAYRIFHFRPRRVYILRLLLFVVLVCFSGYILTALSTDTLCISNLTSICIMAGVSILLSFVLRLIQPKEIFNILKQEE